MKRTLAILLALMLTLLLSAAALAVDGTETTLVVPTDVESVDIRKLFKLTNAGTTSPAETFTFTIAAESVSDSPITAVNGMPPFSPATFTIGFIEGEASTAGVTNTTTITLPTFTSVGVYTYKITETVNATAGVTYTATPLYLTITVINGEEGALIRLVTVTEGDDAKTDTFENSFEAGSLQISKTVTGNLGDKTKEFEVTVTLTAPTGQTVVAPITAAGGVAGNPTSVTVGTPTTFKLKHDDTVTLSNISYGVTYTVAETDYTGEGYTASTVFSDDANKKIDSALDTVAITNDKDSDITTGVSLDDLPYIAILGAVALIGVALLLRRRFAGNRG